MLTRFKCAHRRACKCICECVGSNKMFTLLNTHTHASAHLQYKRTLNYLHPLMIVVITCGGKSHFHKVRFFPPSPSLFSPLTSVSTLHFFPPSSLLSPPAPLFLLSPLICTSPSLFILYLPLALTLHLSPPCGRLIPLSYSFFWPQGYLPSYTASPHPSLSFHLFISMSKSHPFIFLQMNRFCLWKRTGEKRSRMQRNTVSLTP